MALFIQNIYLGVLMLSFSVIKWLKFYFIHMLIVWVIFHVYSYMSKLYIA